MFMFKGKGLIPSSNRQEFTVMARYNVDVKIRNSRKELVKSELKKTKDLQKREDVYESLVWELLEGLPSGEYEFEWIVEEDEQ